MTIRDEQQGGKYETMIPEQWLKDVGDKVVKNYIEDDRNSSLSGNCLRYK